MAISLTISLLTYNRHRELIKTLRSLKGLNYQDFSLIVGDNSNTDGAERIVRKYFPNATYYRNVPSTNEIENSNKCISIAQTEYVCLMHDDDLLLPEYFDSIIAHISRDKSIDLAYTGRQMTDEEDKIIGLQQIQSSQKEYIYSGTDILDFMVLGKIVNNYKVFINTPGLIFKKKIFDKVKGFDRNINTHCDTNFLLKSLAVSQNVLFINKTLFINKIWYGLSGRTKSSENGEVFIAQKEVLENFLDFCQKNKIERYSINKREIFNKFSKDSIAINGPMGWIALRFKGSYLQRGKKLLITAFQILQLNKNIVFIPKFYIILLSSILLPQSLLKQLHKMIISYYITKK